jgi:hypothetical protein
MTAPALVKQSELKRMAAIAKSEGVPIELEVEGRIYRVLPDIPANHNAQTIDIDRKGRGFL